MESYLNYTCIAAMLVITPGPDSLFVLAISLSEGKNKALHANLGVCLGLLLHILLAGLGVSAMLLGSKDFFTFIKYFGSAYLFFLGFQALFAPVSKMRLKAQASSKKTLLKGFITNALNPKVTMFFLALLPQFITAHSSQYLKQVVILGLIYILLTFIWLLIVSSFSTQIFRLENKVPTLTKKLQIFSGLIMISLSLHLLFYSQI